MPLPPDSDRCVITIWHPRGGSSRCTRSARFGDFCGTHDPDHIDARRKARGPTQFEREIAAIHHRTQLQEATDKVVGCARSVVQLRPADHPVHSNSHTEVPVYLMRRLGTALEEYDAARKA